MWGCLLEVNLKNFPITVTDYNNIIQLFYSIRRIKYCVDLIKTNDKRGYIESVEYIETNHAYRYTQIY